MTAVARTLAARALKSAANEVLPGDYEVDEILTLRVTGHAHKGPEELVAPTTSIPYTTAMALLLEKAGVTREAAVRLLREALTEALLLDSDRRSAINDRIKDVDAALSLVKDCVVAQLPKVPRQGKLTCKSVHVELLASEPQVSEQQRQLQDAVAQKLAGLTS